MKDGMSGSSRARNRNAQKTWMDVKTVRIQAHCTEDYRIKVAKRSRDFGGMGKYIRSLVDADLEANSNDKNL